MTEEKYLTVKEVAKIMRVSPITIYRWLKKQTIPAYKFGDTWRFSASEIIEYAKQKGGNKIGREIKKC